MKKEELAARLNTIIEKSTRDNGYHYEAVIKDWENYGKSRTYYSIIETRDGSKHYKVKKYGYYDNIKNEYVPEKYGDLRKDYTFGGMSF